MKRERKGARIVLLTPGGRLLLFHFKYDSGPLAGTEYWGLPGGGVEEGETAAEAAVRELFEETGLRVEGVGEALAESRYDFQLSGGEEVIQRDWYFLLRVPGEVALSRAGFTLEESRSMVEGRWWTAGEISRLAAPVVPADMVGVLARMGV